MRALLVLGCLLASALGGAIAQTVGGGIALSFAQLVQTGLTITPTTGTMNPGLLISQSGPTTGSTSQSYLNQIAITADAANDSTTLDGVQILHSFGGSNLQSARQSLDVKSTFTAASSASNPNRNYVAGTFQIDANSGDGGTNTGAGSAGAIFGHNSVVRCNNGATNLSSCNGAEFDNVFNTGASAKARIGIGSVSWGNSATGGAALDAAYTIATANLQTLQWQNGIVFAHTFYGNKAALSSTGCAICTDGSADTIATGLDLSSFTITGNFLRGPGGYAVNGSGITTQGLITPASSGAACSSGQIEWDANFIYICTATNTWKRATLATF